MICIGAIYSYIQTLDSLRWPNKFSDPYLRAFQHEKHRKCHCESSFNLMILYVLALKHQCDHSCMVTNIKQETKSYPTSCKNTNGANEIVLRFEIHGNLKANRYWGNVKDFYAAFKVNDALSPAVTGSIIITDYYSFRSISTAVKSFRCICERGFILLPGSSVGIAVCQVRSHWNTYKHSVLISQCLAWHHGLISLPA